MGCLKSKISEFAEAIGTLSTNCLMSKGVESAEGRRLISTKPKAGDFSVINSSKASLSYSKPPRNVAALEISLKPA